MQKKILWTVPIMLLAVVFAGAVKTYAGTSESGRGWLWGGSESVSDEVWNGNESGIGWISMNSFDCDMNGNGFSEVLCGGDDVSTNIASYGVNIPSGDGLVTGYAWSENYGWISFNGVDLAGCPVGACSAQRTGNQLTGWARILSIKNDLAMGNSGGWSGWVSLDSTTTGSPVTYGVDVSKFKGSSSNCLTGTESDCNFSWSDELGWIDFSRASVIAPKTLDISFFANPNTCNGCASLSSTLTATRLDTSTATGLITYEFDCDNNGSFEEIIIDSADTSQSYTECSAYTNSSNTARVKMTQEGVSVEKTASITITNCTCDLDTVNQTCASAPKFNDSCGNATCSGKKSCGVSSWKEVAP